MKKWAEVIIFNNVSEENLNGITFQESIHMEIPILRDVPIVSSRSHNFRSVFSNERQYKHFKDYLTGLIVLENKTYANISRCVVNSSDETNLGRFFNNASWSGEELNTKRLDYMIKQTREIRCSHKESVLIIDDTLCKHVKSIFEFIDIHYDHSNQSYIWAHNPVTSHYVSGHVRFPVDFRLYRRYEEFTDWENFVYKHFPNIEIPKKKNLRDKFKKEVEGRLLQDPEFRKLHEEFKSKIALAIQLIKSAIENGVPFSLVLFDSWYLVPELVELLAELHYDWISIVKKNRHLLTKGLKIYDENGKLIKFNEKEISIEDLISLIPKSAFHSNKIDDITYWCFTFTAIIPSIGKVRLVISFNNEKLEGTCCILATNRTDWEAKKIISSYLKRWPIETFYRDGKQYLGFGDYQMRKMEAIKKHWYLVFLSYSLLHLDILHSSHMKEKDRPQTIGEACHYQAQSLVKSLVLWVHRQLSKGVSFEKIMDTLSLNSNKICIA